MNRLTFDEYGCLLALSAKSRAEDPFTRCAAVALDEKGNVLGSGYNGLKSGIEIPEWMKSEKNRARKTDLFIHAESNLCARLVRGQCHTICLNISPCIKCCQQIAALDIKRVIFVKEYEKCDKFKDFCNFHGIECQQLSKESKKNILDYITNMDNFKELYE